MVEEFPQKVQVSNAKLWTKNLFKVDKCSKQLGRERIETFHTFVMKGFFVYKRKTWYPVQDPNENDCSNLIRLLNYLKDTTVEVLILEADDTQTILWYVDAAFAVYKDMRSHSGGIITMGSGAVISLSTKQKVNAHKSTEAELVAVDAL